MYREIPDETERYCFECEKETLQVPDGIEIRPGSRGCFGSRQRSDWKFECTECQTIQI